MLRKEFKYVDYDGNQRTDIAYFNLTKAEIAAMQVRMDGKFIDHLQDLVRKQHIEELFHFFHDLLLDSYGQKSDDGRRIMKTPELRKDFEESIPFSDLLVELIGDPERLSIFIRSIIPPDFAKSIEAGEHIEVQGLPTVT